MNADQSALRDELQAGLVALARDTAIALARANGWVDDATPT